MDAVRQGCASHCKGNGAGRGELQCVTEEVVQYLLDSEYIADEFFR